MLDAENSLSDALQEQAEESSRPDLRQAFESHRKQTEKQADRIEEIFHRLEEAPQQTECVGIAGLVEEHDKFKEEGPSQDLLDIFNAGAAAKVEHYEIAAYAGLIQMAQQMGHKKAVKLLKQNLKQEQETLIEPEGFGKKLKPERMFQQEGEEEYSRTAMRSRRRRLAQGFGTPQPAGAVPVFFSSTM